MMSPSQPHYYSTDHNNIIFSSAANNNNNDDNASSSGNNSHRDGGGGGGDCVSRSPTTTTTTTTTTTQPLVVDHGDENMKVDDVAVAVERLDRLDDDDDDPSQQQQLPPPPQQEGGVYDATEATTSYDNFYYSTSTTTTTSPSNNNNNNNNNYMTLSQEKYSMMMNMTLELVKNLTSVREGDTVYTAYGEGICIQKHSSSCNNNNNIVEDSSRSMRVALSFGTLYHRQPEMIHKLIDANTYSEAMDHLDQVRKLQWTMQCEQWNVSLVGKEQECVACLFDKPHWKAKKSNTTAAAGGGATAVPARKRWFRRSTSNNNKTNNNNNNSSAATKHKSCDVCGNPVCPQHTIGNQSSTSTTNFTMCVDCEFDLTQVVQQQTSSDDDSDNNNNNNNNNNNESSTTTTTTAKGLLDPNHPQLPQTLDRLLQYYTRMVLQLQFWIPTATKELAQLLTDSERNQAKVALGTGSLSFVGAALGVAGAAALMTPAGPAILLAAVATSATSATIQGTHAGVHRYRLKSSTSQLSQVHALSDRLIGWHGLCLGILGTLEELRFQLLSEHEAVLQVLRQQQKDNIIIGSGGSAKMSAAVVSSSMQQHHHQRRLNNSKRYGSSRGSTSSSNKALEVWNTLAVGSFHTTRHGLTGVGLTSALGASYSQLISASMQSVPVVGAAFSVGCMAMDASNIASTINRLSKPSDKAVALYQVKESFSVHIPSTISLEVAALLNAVQDLRLLQEEAQRHQQQDLIEQELQELNFL